MKRIQDTLYGCIMEKASMFEWQFEKSIDLECISRKKHHCLKVYTNFYVPDANIDTVTHLWFHFQLDILAT